MEQEHVLVIVNNLPVYNESGEVLIQNVLSGDNYYVEATYEVLNLMARLHGSFEADCNVEETTEVANVLPHNTDVDTFTDLYHIDPSLDENEDVDFLSNAIDSSKLKAYWTYELTIILINKYKAHYPLFSDSIHTHVQVWDMIAAEFRKDGYAFSATQCENRWKYIRGKYIKKRDNDSDANTGGPYYSFEYYDEIHEILGKKPNIAPKYLSPSSKVDSSSGSLKKSTTSNESRKPHRHSGQSSSSHSCNAELPTFFSDEDITMCEEEEEFRSSKLKSKKEEDNVKRQEKYHNEMMEMQRESLTVFKDVMCKILEEFKKK